MAPIRTLLTLLIALSLVFSPISVRAQENEAKTVSLSLPCKSAILVEQTTGQVLYAQNENERLPIASVTKVMTLLLVMEALDKGTIHEDDLVPISELAASMGGSQAYLEVGESITLRDLLKAVFVSSANDGAVALAELISGTVDAFVAAMNEKARALGMNDTIFYNPTGLDDGETNLSSAKDVSLMSNALLSYRAIYPYTTIWTDSIRGGAFGLANTNKLIRFYPGATGLKTGSTAKAKYCLSASAERNGLKLCAVVLAGETSADRFQAAKTMLDYGFAAYAYFKPEKISLPEIRVWGGESDTLSLDCPSDGILLTKEEAAGIRAEAEFPEEITAPIKKGDVIGHVRYQRENETIFELPIFAEEDVPAITFFHLARRLLRLTVGGKV